MPVILTKPDEIEMWMSAPATEALKLQRALPDDALRVVARGQRRTCQPTTRGSTPCSKAGREL